MSDLFKKPITCELKLSHHLSFIFIVVTLLPALSLWVLFEKYLWLVIILNGIAFMACVYYLRQYALRINSTSILKVRLHRGVVTTTQRNLIEITYRIKKVSLAPEWVIFISDNNKRILIDQFSTDLVTYSSIRREVNKCNLD